MTIAFRANLIAHSSEILRWDACMDIGIGKGESLTDKITKSDGEAFHLSGKAFDCLNENSRMRILTPYEDFNDELRVSMIFGRYYIRLDTLAG